jgi:hypothetical protein
VADFKLIFNSHICKVIFKLQTSPRTPL